MMDRAASGAAETMDGARGRVRRLAETLSGWIDPRYLVGPVVLVAALLGAASWIRAVGWTLLVLAIVVLPVLAFIALQTRRGVYADNEVPARCQRTQAYWVGNGCVLVCLLVLIGLRAPRSLVALVLSMFTSSTTGTALNMLWKVSVHTGAVAGAAVSMLALLGPPALPALLLVPLVGWMRVALGRHTVAQVIAGGLVGAGMTATVFWFMSPL